VSYFLLNYPRFLENNFRRLNCYIFKIFDETWPLFCILDTDGKTLALENGWEFIQDGKVDDALLKEFFDKYTLETPDAEKLLADAQAKAKQENKRIFLLMAAGVNQSPPSSRLSEVLDEHRKTLEQDYVFVTIDAKRWKNGEAVIARLRSNPDRSVPGVTILDPEAKVMATSKYRLPFKARRDRSFPQNAFRNVLAIDGKRFFRSAEEL
jgi:hypothetical protein